MKVDSIERHHHDSGNKDRNLIVRSHIHVPARVAVAVRENGATPEELKQCVLHPSSDTHALINCKRLLSMDVKDR